MNPTTIPDFQFRRDVNVFLLAMFKTNENHKDAGFDAKNMLALRM